MNEGGMKLIHYSYLVLIIFFSLNSVALATDSACHPATTAIPRWCIGAPVCEGTSCQLCHLFQLIQNIIEVLVTYLFPIAIAGIVYGGVMIMLAFGSPERVSKGKRAIQVAITGVLITLFAFTIVGIFLQLVTGSSGFFWNTIKC